MDRRAAAVPNRYAATTAARGEGTAQWTDPSDPTNWNPIRSLQPRSIDEPTPRPEPDQPQTTLDPLDVDGAASPAAAPLPASPASGRPTEMAFHRGCSSASARRRHRPVLIGFIAFSILSREAETGLSRAPHRRPRPQAPVPSRRRPSPRASATPEPTPEPTPAGPPAAGPRGLGDGHRGQAKIRTQPAATGLHHTLIRGAVLTVTEVRTRRARRELVPRCVPRWRRRLGPSGFTRTLLETILNDPVLIRCGGRPSLDVVDGSRRHAKSCGLATSCRAASSSWQRPMSSRGIARKVCVTARLAQMAFRLSSRRSRLRPRDRRWEGLLAAAADREAGVSAQIKDKANRPPDPVGRTGRQRQSSSPGHYDDDVVRRCRWLRLGNINVDGDKVDTYRALTVGGARRAEQRLQFKLRPRPAVRPRGRRSRLRTRTSPRHPDRGVRLHGDQSNGINRTHGPSYNYEQQKAPDRGPGRGGRPAASRLVAIALTTFSSARVASPGCVARRYRVAGDA